MRRLWLLSMILIVLAACQTSTPTPIVNNTAVPATSVPASSTPTPASSPTSAPMVTPTMHPTATSTPTATPTATASPTTAPTQAVVKADVYVSADNTLNLRSEPSITATVLRTLSPGTHLTAINPGATPDAAGIMWQNVRTDDGQSGWVAAQYLTKTAPATPTPSPTPSGAPVVTPIAQAGYVYVASTAGLNLRAGHTAASNAIAALANGQRLQTNGLGFGPDHDGITWLNVKTDDNLEGWVAADFVSAQVPSVATATPPANAADIAGELLRRTNDLRAQHGLPPYTLDAGLSALALEHSKSMSQNGITHIGAEGWSATKRLTLAGYGGHRTENIFGGQASIDDAWEYWSTDPPHLANLLNSTNTVIGIGVYEVGAATYYTQDFAQPPR